MSLLSLKLGSKERSLNNYFDCQLSALLACCSPLRGTCAIPSELSFAAHLRIQQLPQHSKDIYYLT